MKDSEEIILKEAVSAYIIVLCRDSPGETEVNHKKAQSG
jgi:hypothetical protein